MHTFVCRVASITFSLLLAVGTTRAGDVYVQTNLVSNMSGMGTTTVDPNLQGAWGLSFSTTSPFWISDQFTNVATLYSVTNTQPLSASIFPSSAMPLVVPIRQSRRLDFGVEHAGYALDDHGDRRQRLVHRAGDREPAGAGGCRPDLRCRPEQRQHRRLQ